MIRKNIFANLIGKFWSLLSGFLFIPLYIKYLGFESYSVISFTLMIAGIMAILDGGLTATLSREFARKDSDQKEKIKIYKNLETLYFLITTICICTIFLLSRIIAEKWARVEGFTEDQIILFLRIISIEIGFQLLFRFYIGGFLGMEKHVQANAFQVAWGIFRNGFVIILLLYFPTLEMFFLWQTVCTIFFSILIKIFLDKIILKKITFNINLKLEKLVLLKIWKFAAGMMLIALVAALNTQLDKLAISKLLSIENLGYYTLAISVSQVLIIIVNPISTALLPRFTSHFSANENEQARTLYLKSGVLVSILIFSLMMVMSFFGKEIVWIWTGEKKLAIQTHHLIPILSLAYSMYALQPLPYVIAISNGYTKLNNILGILSLVVTLPGYFYFTSNYGLIGAASIFCCVQVISTVVYFFFINKKFIKCNIFTLYWKQFILPSLTAGIIVFSFSKIPMLLDYNRIFSLFWIGFVTFATLVITLAFLMPFKEIKSIINFRKSKI